MPHIITSDNKAGVIDMIEQIIERYLFNGCTITQRNLLRSHIFSLRHDPRDLTVNCKLETVPELDSTRVHLEISFNALPSFADPAQAKI